MKNSRLKPRVITAIKSWQRLRSSLPSNQTVGFVPTLGNLHQGHASLLRKARDNNDFCVLSIFVNPTQFNDPNDYLLYPKTIEQDIRIAMDLGIDYIFLPESKAMYADEYNYKVQENNISQILEGKYRPQHFEGVLTIVLKLFSLIKPHRAYFGEKDFQQLSLIQGMVEAFFMDIEIIPCQTIRHQSGLAMSSRNSRLSQTALAKSYLLAKYLSSGKSLFEIKAALERAGFQVEYLEKWKSRLHAAVYLDNVRLIDNVLL
ncbi:MAG: pantoate--beta-alanine ligase [Proteobacteria bacterium]|nr:pantoate--beta-alanine ligase [Pseudomonadota bacterium]